MANQRQIIKEYLQNNGRITGAIAFTELNVYRLSEYISRLRKDGMDITTVMELNPNTGKEYGVYLYQRELKSIE